MCFKDPRIPEYWTSHCKCAIPFLLIFWSFPTFAPLTTSLTWDHGCGDLCSFISKSTYFWLGTNVQQEKLLFQVFPKEFRGVKVRVLCWPLEFFHFNLGKPYGLHFCIRAMPCWIMFGRGFVVPIKGNLNARAYTTSCVLPTLCQQFQQDA